MSNVIGKSLGIASAACFVPLGAKYPLRKLKMDKANAALMKCHEGASAGLFVLGIAHMAAELSTKEGRESTAKICTGAAALALSTWLITDCHIAKDQEKKMQRHRWYSLGLAAGIAGHIAADYLTD